MKFALRRRVDGLSYEEIDSEIETQQQRAKILLDELADTLQRQSELYHEIKEERLARRSSEKDKRDL
jgi:predicted  nucleic acid-binding Zn-ribbon protein